VNRRLELAFHNLDGMRQAILTGPAAGDHVFVDIATGALPMNEAILQEALRRGYAMTLSVDAAGVISFGTPECETRFQQANNETSRDPRGGNSTPRPIRGDSDAQPTSATAERNARIAGESADALLAAIGRIDRAQQKITDSFFIHFSDVGTLLVAGTVANDRARQVFGGIGKLLSAGRGNPSSRVVLTAASSVHAEARALLTAHDHGATPCHVADIPLPDAAEIQEFLSRAKEKHALLGGVQPVATMLVQRGYTLTRISETLRRIISDGGRDLTAVIGGEADEQKLREAQKRLDAMVGLSELKGELAKIVKELAAIHDALKRGQISEPTSTHFALLGRPGTGKTQVAQIVAALLHACGLRRRNHCIRATSADIIGQFNSGEAIQNIRRLMKEAADGVLFIDEAYTLAENDWGRQAIDVLIAEMEERRGSLTVILAGYPARMQRLFEANEGLRSRLAHISRLPDYTSDELCEILDRQLRSASISVADDAREAAHAIVRREATRCHSNGRDVRNLFDRWNRERLASGAPTLERSHITDPRQPDRAAAEQRMDQYARRFKGLPEIESWMRQTMLTSFDALGSGRLPRAPRLIFAGPPGTGKTESAREIGNFLRACGVLRDGRVVETSLKDFTSQFSGGAHERTERHFRDAAESVLFIDEIYSFVDDPQGRGVLDQIVASLTNPEFENVAVVIAGYEERMPDVFRANAGLKDRFDRVLRFSWPDTPTLAAIALDRLRRDFGREPATQDLEAVRGAVERAIKAERQLPGFAGARTAKKVSDAINAKIAERGGGARVMVDDVPATPAGPALSEIVARYLREHPSSTAAAEVLHEILAAVKLHSRMPASKALGLCIVGNPGSGKSTFVRWFINALSKRDGMAPVPWIERSAQSLQGTYLGHAQQNVRDVFEQARGGWIFLDEFHALRAMPNTQSSLYSQEIAREIVAQMTAPSNIGTKVVIAGYPDELEGALGLDPGLPSRFERVFRLPDPSDEALARAAYRRLSVEYGGSGSVSYETLESVLLEYFTSRRRAEGAGFSGYRVADSFAERVATNAIRRADGDDERFVIELDDILGALRT
jgi:SpoVK/Ycf46/Vps4 family AAA+-type ATPase